MKRSEVRHGRQQAAAFVEARAPAGSEKDYTHFHEVELSPGDQYTFAPGIWHWLRACVKSHSGRLLAATFTGLCQAKSARRMRLETTFHTRSQAGDEGAIVSEFSPTSRGEFDEFTDPRIKRCPTVEED